MKDTVTPNPAPETPPEASAGIVWAKHYTPDDIAGAETINLWLSERGFSRAALARLARVSPAGLTQIIGGYYPSPPAKQLASIRAAMRHADAQLGQKAAQAAVETSLFKLAQIACDMARKYRNFSMVTGYVGTGKTFAIQHYAATHPNTHFVEAHPCMSAQSLIRLLARQVAGVDSKSSIASKFELIVNSLKNTASLVIVDEAETLTPAQLHLLRRVRDTADIGVVLAGTEHLAGLIRPAHGQFDQIRSRVGFWPETVKGITAEDAAALTQSAFGKEEVPDAVIERLFAYAKGSARMLSEGLIAALKEFRGGRPLDVKLVDAVAKQALCLQSLA